MSLKVLFREKTLREAVFDPKLTSCPPLSPSPLKHNACGGELERAILPHVSTYTLTHTFTFTHLYVLAPKACHSHIFKKSLVPHLNKHFLGPWSNNYGNNIQHPAMTGIILALFINKVICEVLPTGGRKNMLTHSNGIWPNGNDILTAAICNAGATMSCQRVVQY